MDMVTANLLIDRLEREGIVTKRFCGGGTYRISVEACNAYHSDVIELIDGAYFKKSFDAHTLMLYFINKAAVFHMDTATSENDTISYILQVKGGGY